MDAWTFLVIDLFGSFWAAVFVMIFLIYIIGIMGALSQQTLLSYISWFLFVMVIGYGNVLLSVPMFFGIIFIYGIAIPRMINAGST